MRIYCAYCGKRCHGEMSRITLATYPRVIMDGRVIPAGHDHLYFHPLCYLQWEEARSDRTHTPAVERVLGLAVMH